MAVSVVCENCGFVHQIPDRRFDPATGRTACPKCGTRAFRVRREGLRWHPR